MYRIESLYNAMTTKASRNTADGMAEYVINKILYETLKPNAEVYPAQVVAGRLRAIGCKDTAKAIETLSPVLRF